MIAEQEASGISIRAFCKRNDVSDHSFYFWRRRLRQNRPVEFALLQTVAGKEAQAPIELFLPSGERLLIASGVDAATLRIVLDALRP
jgi:transposase